MEVRLYGSQYDSIRQRDEFYLSFNMVNFLARISSPRMKDSILNHAKSSNYKNLKDGWGLTNYKVRMFLDLMFVNKIVLTDAQVFDGSYFHRILEEENTSEWKDFLNFLHLCNHTPDNSLIEIRLRKETPEASVRNMIDEGFRFSSIGKTELCLKVESTIKSILASDDKEHYATQTLEGRFGMIKARLETGEKGDFQDFTDRIFTLLHSIPPGLFVVCEKFDWNEAAKVVKENSCQHINSYVPMSSVLNSNKAYRELHSKVIESFDPYTERPKRSEILLEIDKLKAYYLEGSSIDDTGISIQNTETINHLSNFGKMYNYVYNRVLAQIVECNYTDVGNLPNTLFPDNHNKGNDSLNGCFFYALSEATWSSMFNIVFQNPAVSDLKAKFHRQIQYPDSKSDLLLMLSFDNHIQNLLKTVAPRLDRRKYSIGSAIKKTQDIMGSKPAFILKKSLTKLSPVILGSVFTLADIFLLLLGSTQHEFTNEIYKLMGNTMQVLSNGACVMDEGVHALYYQCILDEHYNNPCLQFFEPNTVSNLVGYSPKEA